MLSRNTYHLPWVSLTLDKGYLLTVAPPDLEHGIAPLSPPGPSYPMSEVRGGGREEQPHVQGKAAVWVQEG